MIKDMAWLVISKIRKNRRLQKYSRGGITLPVMVMICFSMSIG
jgi:hypothetical protein